MPEDLDYRKLDVRLSTLEDTVAAIVGILDKGEFLAKGNCAMFVSFGWFRAGLLEYRPAGDLIKEGWLLGWVSQDHRIFGSLRYNENDWLSEGEYLFEGSVPFRDAEELFKVFNRRHDDPNEPNFSHSVQWYDDVSSIPFTDTTLQNNIGAGDLIYNRHNAGVSEEQDHVMLIVGWSVDIPDYSPSRSNGAPPVFPTYDLAKNYFDLNPEEYEYWTKSVWPGLLVLWGVDHGGGTPQTFARPITQMGTGGPTEIANTEYNP